MLKFGDTFKYREKNYVYLAKTEEITYAAEIINEELSRWLDNVHKKKIVNSANTKMILNMPLYCFVMLRTEPFQKRAAHFYNAGKGDAATSDNSLFDPRKESLNEIDLKHILEEIKKGTTIPRELKKLTEDIEI